MPGRRSFQAAQYFDYTVSPGANTYPMVTVTITVKDGMTLPAGCEWTFSLNSYTTQGSTWATSGTQSLLDHQSTTLDSSKTSDTLTVQEPACFGQTDFYLGTTRFDGTDGALPHYNDSVVPTNLIAWSNGGQACTSNTAALTLVKQLSENAPSGDSPSDWTLSATAAGATSAALTGPGGATGQVAAPATYTLAETGGPSDKLDYTAGAWSCVLTGTTTRVTVTDSSVALTAGQDVTCTIVNTYTPPQGPTVNLTVEKLICPSYGVVPANNNPTSDADYPSGMTLDTSYQTGLTDPATDIPTGCTPASGWQFDVGTGASSTLKDYIGTVTHTLTTGTNGTDTLTLSPAEVAMIQNATTWDQGLLVQEVMQSTASFGELRCYRDIENGDNLELLYNKDGLFTSDLTAADGTLNLYCIAYNVAPTPPTKGTLTFVKVVSGGSAVPGDFTMTYVGPNVLSSGTAKSGDVKTLPFSTYTVGEQPVANYSLTSTACVPNGSDAAPVSQPILSVDNPNWTCTLTNTYTPPTPPTKGTLMVVKNTSGGDGAFSFTGTGTGVGSSFNVTTTSGTGSQTFPGLTPGSGYAVSENAASGWTQTGATCNGEGNSPSAITIVAGQTVTCTFTNTKNTTPYIPFTPVTPLTPKIAIAKVANPTHLGVGGGSVTYTYSVTNPGQVALTNVTVGDDKCAPVTYVSGDTNGNHALDLTEAWTYTCTTTITQTTTNTATASGQYGTQTVTATAQAVVSVAPPTPKATTGGVLGATGTPSLPPTTSLPGQGGGPNGTIFLLLGVLGAASLALITLTLLRERLLDSVDR